MIPTLLLILDGWGLAPDSAGNAVTLAETPFLDSLPGRWPSARLACSGRAVGLPEGFMGNSEVGHMNLGAGRVVYQEMTRIDVAIEDGSFFENSALVRLMDAVKASGGRLHLLGLLSDGGVHSHVNHLHALLDMAKSRGVEQCVIHAILDGRDTPPSSGLGYVEALDKRLAETGYGAVGAVMGRFWCMDRDKRWDRVERAYKALTLGEGERAESATEAVRAAYAAGETDEFAAPRLIVNAATGELPLVVEDGDGLFVFNFRADRAREISRAFFEDDFSGFPREVRPRLAGFATMTRYEATFPMDVAFPPRGLERGLGEIVSEKGWKQLRLAETEKYAHVTYFFNGGREEPFPGEDRVLVPSPREVPTYDLKPEMSAPEVAREFLSRWPKGDYALGVVNLANLDMVGHTGDIRAAQAACRAVDEAAQAIISTVLQEGGRVILTADHGNAEEMLDAQGGTQTAHSMNPVPILLIGPDSNEESDMPGLIDGKLGDVAPTILDLWGLNKPEEMTGVSLLIPAGGGA